MPTPDPQLDPLLPTAIEQTRLLRLRYRNRDRIVEPHDYGEHNGVIKLLTWQIAGSSSGPLPNWRWMETDLTSDLASGKYTGRVSGERTNQMSRRSRRKLLFHGELNDYAQLAICGAVTGLSSFPANLCPAL